MSNSKACAFARKLPPEVGSHGKVTEETYTKKAVFQEDYLGGRVYTGLAK